MRVGPVIIIYEFTYKDWKQGSNKSMTLERHNLVQTHPDYPTIKATDDDVNNYNRWSHVNDVAREFILTSLAPMLYAKLQNFELASDMLEFLEVRFGKQYIFLK
jgi:hypothetical protein